MQHLKTVKYLWIDADFWELEDDSYSGPFDNRELMMENVKEYFSKHKKFQNSSSKCQIRVKGFVNGMMVYDTIEDVTSQIPHNF